MHSPDGEDEFDEGLRDPTPRVDIKAEFVMARLRFWTKACPALMTRAECSRFNPHMGRSRDFRPP